VQVTLVTVIPLRSLAAPLSLQMCCLGGGGTHSHVRLHSRDIACQDRSQL
jgi:hypothetical protein